MEQHLHQAALLPVLQVVLPQVLVVSLIALLHVLLETQDVALELIYSVTIGLIYQTSVLLHLKFQNV